MNFKSVEIVEIVTFLSSVCILYTQCICKVFKPLYLFHILLRYSLILKWIK